MYILSNKKTHKSARKLKEALIYEGYEGSNINFGCSTLNGNYEPMLNSLHAVSCAVNKKYALQLMEAAELPTALISEYDARIAVQNGIKVIGRKTYHSKGRGFYMCSTEHEIANAISRGATHFQTYIENAREFRVHIVKEQSIKISEKMGTGARKNHSFGATFQYPQEFYHKKTLRRLAKEAVGVLGLDFGAVDLLYKDDKWYILEVNSAPCLTDETSDTLACYVRAFMQTS